MEFVPRSPILGDIVERGTNSKWKNEFASFLLREQTV